MEEDEDEYGLLDYAAREPRLCVVATGVEPWGLPTRPPKARRARDGGSVASVFFDALRTARPN